MPGSTYDFKLHTEKFKFFAIAKCTCNFKMRHSDAAEKAQIFIAENKPFFAFTAAYCRTFFIKSGSALHVIEVPVGQKRELANELAGSKLVYNCR